MTYKSNARKRAYIAIASTTAGLIGIVGFHTSKAVPALVDQRTSSLAGSGANGHSRSGSEGTGSGGGTPNTNGNSPAQPPSSNMPSVVRSTTGATEQFGYGALAVKVAVSGNRIIRVSVPLIQVADSYSGNIASQVIPMLRSQVLSLQSARINGVSGATYTSEAYAMSLQSALDKLHVK
jgi:hypothetical protein